MGRAVRHLRINGCLNGISDVRLPDAYSIVIEGRGQSFKKINNE